MAMPRYRYAIGQAPVRFPSPAPSAKDNEDKESSTPAAPGPVHTHVASKATPPVTDGPNAQRRGEPARVRLEEDRRRTKSMYEGAGSAPSLYPASQPSRHLSPRASWADLQTRERGEGKVSSQSTERTPLHARGGDMLQRQQRPASTSVSASIRPSSLFWTDYAGEEQQAEVVGQGTATNNRLTKSKSSYGAVESAPASYADDDPYGYRAMAGPALLPSFHEQQREQQRHKEAKSRTCGPLRMVLCEKRHWLTAALFGLAVLVGGLWYVFL